MKKTDEQYDFGGWATKNDVKCSDGRTIRENAFKDQDGVTVPLVWNHQHNSVDNVIGRARLENRPEGVWAYGSFNNTEAGQRAKQLVEHGDVDSMSIFAKAFKQDNARNVMHGKILEVSLVLAGANDGAKITDVMSHDDGEGDYVVAEFDQPLDFEDTIYHARLGATKDPDEEEPEEEPKPKKKPAKTPKDPDPDDDDETIAHAEAEGIWNSFTDDEKELVATMGAVATGEAEVDEEELDVMKQAFEELDENKQEFAYAVIGKLIEDAEGDDGAGNTVEQSEIEEGENVMKNNAFNQNAGQTDDVVYLTHDDMSAIIEAAKSGTGSVKAAAARYMKDQDADLSDIICPVFAHNDIFGHAIENPEVILPDYVNVDRTPVWVKRRSEWVSAVLNGVHHVPYSHIRSRYADITEYDARAKGYITGNEKFEESFPLFSRTTNPTTIYKKQSIDRDLELDITDFDVIAWLKGEMRIMLDEEEARAILISDGRDALAPDKIKEDCIRPIWKDNDVYAVHKTVVVAANATDDMKAKAFIRQVVKTRKFYFGKGQPTLFTSEDMLTDMLLMEDSMGRVIYDTPEKLKTALRVKDIVTVPQFENCNRVVNGQTRYLLGMYVNLDDYDLGADKGASPTMFEDFDIDFNKEKYLIETRASGALVVPKSAIVLELVYGFTLDVTAGGASTSYYGKTGAQLQSNVYVHDDAVQGNLKYVTGYTGFSGDTAEQEGNYIALDVTKPSGSTLVGIYGGAEKDFGTDTNIVIRMVDKHKKLTLRCTTTDGIVVERELDFTGLKLAPKA